MSGAARLTAAIEWSSVRRCPRRPSRLAIAAAMTAASAMLAGNIARKKSSTSRFIAISEERVRRPRGET